MSAETVLIEAQDWYAVRDNSIGDCTAIHVRERKSYRQSLDDCVIIGRDLCLPVAAIFTPPVCAICAIMAKDQECEGLAGTARVVWCTSRAADSKVYISVVSKTGPWTLQIDDLNEVQCHDFQFSAPIVNATHWFYVVSESVACGVQTSAVGVFCTTSEVVVAIEGLSMSADLQEHVPGSLAETTQFTVSDTAVKESTDQAEVVGMSGAAVLSQPTRQALNEETSEFTTAVSETP